MSSFAHSYVIAKFIFKSGSISMVCRFRFKCIINYPEFTFHVINSSKYISANCPLQCSVMISFWRHCLEYSKFQHCLLFSWFSNIFESKSVCYSSSIPSAWVTHSDFFIFMNISHTIGIACIVNNSCRISIVLISQSKCFNLVILLRRISPFVSQISKFLIQGISSSIYSLLSIWILMTFHFVNCLCE